MKTDTQLKADVTAELHWDPAVHAENIGVAVQDGVVNLSGTLDTFAQKHAVERAVRRVSGVRAVALDLEVRLAPGHRRNDLEIAQAATRALQWHSLVPADKVHVQVEDGWVTLTGEVDWAYQQASAEQCIHPLVGVRGIDNKVTLKPRAKADGLSESIQAALARHARREGKHIHVHVNGAVVTLEGQVDSIADHDAAIGTVSGAKGVSRVIDQLRVVP